MIIIIVIIIAIMMLMIKIILIIVVVIIINSPFEPDDIFTRSTDLLNILYTSDLYLDHKHKHFKVVLLAVKTVFSLTFLFFPDCSTLQKNKIPYLRRHGKEAITKRHLVKKVF